MKKKKAIDANYMDIIYRHQQQLNWSVRGDGMVVLDMVNKGFYHKIAQTFFHKPRVSHIALDAYGTALWNAIDGTNTVYDIVQHMQKQFPEEQERMLDRVVTFLHTLHAHHFIEQS